MRVKNLVTAFAGLALLLAASPASAQSLGEVARQQREKQAKQAKKPSRVFTNDDAPAHPREEPAAAGSEPSTVAVAAKAEPAPTGPGSVDTKTENMPNAAGAASKEEKPEDKIKTKDYWQGVFKAARKQVDDAQEQQQLLEDELQLLQIRQAREIGLDTQPEIAQKIANNAAPLESSRTATAKAKKTLEDLQKEFKDSGAPEEWGKSDEVN